MGLGLYIIANVYTWVSNDAIIKESVKCKFCRKRISPKVSLSFCFDLCAEVDGDGFADSFENGIGAEVCELYELAGREGGAVLKYGIWRLVSVGKVKLLGYQCELLLLLSQFGTAHARM